MILCHYYNISSTDISNSTTLTVDYPLLPNQVEISGEPHPPQVRGGRQSHYQMAEASGEFIYVIMWDNPHLFHAAVGSVGGTISTLNFVTILATTICGILHAIGLPYLIEIHHSGHLTTDEDTLGIGELLHGCLFLIAPPPCFMLDF